MCIHGIDIEEVSNCVFFFMFFILIITFLLKQNRQLLHIHMYICTLYVQMFMHT